jgi:SAM-dependent methyltransferase
MRTHLQGIVAEAMQISRKDSPTVLDIGCNDGTLLAFYPPGAVKFGIDPSDIAIERSGDAIIVQDIFPSEQLIEKLAGRECDIVTSIAMFYDLEDPIAFSRGVKRIMGPDGIWVFEMSYMPTMLRMNSYDTICHEHLEYYSLAVIEYILRQAGLKIINVSLNTINGGSIRCIAAHALSYHYQRDEFAQNIKGLRQEEFDLALDTDAPYRHFQDRINVHREELNTLLKKLRREGKRIHLYGASTKGNTILQWCGIDNRIVEAAAERNPDKFGAHTLGTDIPIISEQESRAMNPDYYLVLPWHFKEEFVDREKEMLARGTGLIFPLPTIEIIRR